MTGGRRRREIGCCVKSSLNVIEITLTGIVGALRWIWPARTTAVDDLMNVTEVALVAHW
jgi:hypothetical protein